jgi:hypothetical protein
MAEDTTPPRAAALDRRTERNEAYVRLAVALGLVVALIGLVDGLVMAFRRHAAQCPNGHYFPPGTTNFSCYVHPHAGEGIATAVFSILLGTLVCLAGISAVASLHRGSSGEGSDATQQPDAP